jgi:hypothetical protein
MYVNFAEPTGRLDAAAAATDSNRAWASLDMSAVPPIASITTSREETSVEKSMAEGSETIGMTANQIVKIVFALKKAAYFLQLGAAWLWPEIWSVRRRCDQPERERWQ